MADNATLARSLYDAWNERNFDELAEAVAPNAQLTVVGTGETFQGPDGTRKYNTNWANAFPDAMITVDRLISAGEYVVIEYTGRGTHTGTLVTSMGDIPATGRSLTMHLCDVTKFKDGKVQEQHSYFDTGSMMAQLGITAEQVAAKKK